MNELQRTIEYHAELINKSQTSWGFFLAITDLVKLVKIIPNLEDNFITLQKNYDNATWFDEINWNEKDIDVQKIWYKMIFIYRIIYDGVEWEANLRCGSDKLEQCYEWQKVRSALSEIQAIKNNETKERQFFLIRESFDEDINHFVCELLNYLSISTETIQDHQNELKQIIRYITFKKLKENDFEIFYAVNGDFSRIYKAKYKGNWKNMYELAEKKVIELSSNDAANNFKDYFNSDQRNQLWAKRSFNRCALLEINRGVFVSAKDSVIIEVIPIQSWSRQINRVSN